MTSVGVAGSCVRGGREHDVLWFVADGVMVSWQSRRGWMVSRPTRLSDLERVGAVVGSCDSQYNIARGTR